MPYFVVLFLFRRTALVSGSKTVYQTFCTEGERLVFQWDMLRTADVTKAPNHPSGPDSIVNLVTMYVL
jgi:hypothetical protein